MPEATETCMYEEVSFTDTAEDGLTFDVVPPCGLPADHRVVLEIEGAGRSGDHRVQIDYLCCHHRSDTLAEIMASEHTGVSVVGDVILNPTISYEVQPSVFGWFWCVSVDSVNGRHRLPAARLHALTYTEAVAEAEVRTERLREIARGNDGQMPL